MQHTAINKVRNFARVDTKLSALGTPSKTIVACFKPSSVADAGFGGFCTSIGSSGQRYVFSKTTTQQAILYDNALFAVGDIGSGKMIVGDDALSLWFDGISRNAELFVHILDGKDGDRDTVMRDLRVDA